MPMDPTEVDAKLSFAERRMRELLGLNGRDVAGADPDDRDRQTAEFFSHLVSATEVLARYVNEASKLGLPTENVSVTAVKNSLGPGSTIGTVLGDLYVNTRKEPYPTDPYVDDTLIYRILLYRHHTTHRRRAPFQIEMGQRTVHLHLDPEDPAKGASRDPIEVELPRMLELIRARCHNVLALL
jgi:hypothetical protein